MIEYNNKICWFCESKPMTATNSLPVIVAKGNSQETIVIPRCAWCANYWFRQKFFWFSLIIAGIIAMIFGTAWTENLPIGAAIGIATFFLLYRLKRSKHKKIVTKQKIKTAPDTILNFPNVKAKLKEGWEYKGIKYRG